MVESELEVPLRLGSGHGMDGPLCYKRFISDFNDEGFGLDSSFCSCCIS